MVNCQLFTHESNLAFVHTFDLIMQKIVKTAAPSFFFLISIVCASFVLAIHRKEGNQFSNVSSTFLPHPPPLKYLIDFYIGVLPTFTKKLSSESKTLAKIVFVNSNAYIVPLISTYIKPPVDSARAKVFSCKTVFINSNVSQKGAYFQAFSKF
jgi:hypothetical protein